MQIELVTKRCKKKLINGAFELYGRFFINYDRLSKEESDTFYATGFDLNKGIEKLNEALSSLNLGPFDYRIDSIHWVVLSCLSLKHTDIRRILEIGTGRGETTAVLSKLFPQASITTIDLPQNDPLMRSFYGRWSKEKFSAFLETQKKNTAFENVELIHTNSFFLQSKVEGLFDLVFIDGGHLYPDIAWDISNGWNMCKKGGHVLIDDVIQSSGDIRNHLVSTDSKRILEYIEARIPVQFVFFLKRRSALHIASKYGRHVVYAQIPS